MRRSPAPPRSARRGESGQVLALGAILAMVLVLMAALVLEGGNAYAQQRLTQNGADAAANAGAVVLAERLGGATRTDADVAARVAAVATSNQITSFSAEYTDVRGRPLDTAGAVAASSGQPVAAVGGGAIPPNAQGVQVHGTRTFGTLLAGAIGRSTFDASADAAAVTGALTGGPFIPVIFPISISDCDNSGVTQPFGEDQWVTSEAPQVPGGYPDGPEYIVPLCKTNAQGGGGGGSFQILDLDPGMDCEEEAADPPLVYWETFPVQVAVDNGNNCARPVADVVNAEYHLDPVLIPICQADCVPDGSGSNATYEVIGVTAFVIDAMFDSNNPNNSDCLGGTGSNGDPLVNVIGGNGSSSCVHGWFIQFITAGPVGTGPVGDTDAIGVQLIR